MGIPPERDWLAYCIDEAIHVLSAGHHVRDRRWEEAFKREPGEYGDEDLIDRLRREPGRGQPPSSSQMAALDAAQGGGGRMSGDV